MSDQAYSQDAIMLSITNNLSVSTDAYMDLLQKQTDTARKNAEVIDRLSTRADQDQKALARQRVEEIKKQIEALRKMLALFGGKDAKAVLQQLKQLASQLKQAAGVLKTAADTGFPDISAVPADEQGSAAAATSAEEPATDGHEEARQAYAEQQSSAEAEVAGAAMRGASDAAQRAEDAKQVEAVTQALKSLKAALERQVKKQDGRV
ncbi:hypothetical protein GTP38_16860 [Duganella sp. FT94W]|uniref:Uncharacterized protein n=1 Tax=Duganella lactea TaxID=2692173 RepID=A0ABW9V902_9BURK|nr:hypothetical protein [Duganella lactea]MYM36005.1 hypothetical protein [Duganella lactea]